MIPTPSFWKEVEGVGWNTYNLKQPTHLVNVIIVEMCVGDSKSLNTVVILDLAATDVALIGVPVSAGRCE